MRLVQWWYGHNAVGFLLTTPFLGMMYYFLPKAANRPVYSYRLSIIHFWALVFVYIWAGPHHLHYTALPDWAQTLGMVFSLILWAPSWGGMLNGLLTLRGAWNRVRESAILKFLVLSVTFYGYVNLRRADDVDQVDQQADALHRLDHRARTRRGTRLGRFHDLRLPVLHDTEAMEAEALLRRHGDDAFLGSHHRTAAVRDSNLVGRTHAGADVARLRCGRITGISELCRDNLNRFYRSIICGCWVDFCISSVCF